MLDIDHAPGAINGLSVLGIVTIPFACVAATIPITPSTPMMPFLMLCMVLDYWSKGVRYS